MYVIMTMFSWNITPTRQMLIETIENHPNYKEFSRADLLEIGLKMISVDIRDPENKNEDEALLVLDEKKIKQLYSKPMTKQEYKAIDRVVNTLNLWHDKKWKKDDWLES